MICPKCNTENNDSLKYCVNCGEPLTKTFFNETKEKNKVNSKNDDPNINNIFGVEENVNITKAPETLDFNTTVKEETLINPKVIKNENKELEQYIESQIKEENLQVEIAKEMGAIEPTVEEVVPIVQPPLKEEVNTTIVNPTSEEEEKLEEKLNIWIIIKLIIGALFKPGTTIRENSKPYNSLQSGLTIYTTLSTIAFIGVIVCSFINGCFIKVYDINTSTYSTTLDLGNVANLDYVNIIIMGILLTYGVVLLFTTIYYIASFLTNKGLTYGKYLTVISFSLLPYLLFSCLIAQIVNIFSGYFGLVLLIFGLIYSLIILITVLNDMLTFKDTNQKIMYHTLLIAISIFIIGVVASIIFSNQLSSLNIRL